MTSPLKTNALAIALLLGGEGCALAPVLHQVEIANFGHVAASVTGQAILSAGGIQGEAQAAVGVLPHVQLEGSAAGGLGGSWSAGGGLRGQIPVSQLVSLQVAGLYGHQGLGTAPLKCEAVIFCNNGSAGSANVDTGTLEAGVVARTSQEPRAVAWGLWVSEGLGVQAWNNPGVIGSSGYNQFTANVSFEVPFNDARTWNLLSGFSLRVGDVNAASNAATTTALTVGSGIVARF